MTETLSWDVYRSFLAVLQEGSLSAAARALGVTQPTVGRHIDALEAALALSLFTRTASGLQPTAAATALRALAQDMANTASALRRTAASQGEGVHGVVRVTASEVVGVEVLPPILGALRAQHPGLRIELVLSNQVQDLLHREADIAVRMTAPVHGQLIARRVGAIEVGLHATPGYCQQYGLPTQPEALAAHAVIGFDRLTPFIRRAAKAVPGFHRETFAFCADSDLAQLALIRAGAGVGMCQVPLARREGWLRVMPDEYSLALETWVSMHEDLRNNPACRHTFDALVRGLQAYLQS